MNAEYILVHVEEHISIATICGVIKKLETLGTDTEVVVKLKSLTALHYKHE